MFSDKQLQLTLANCGAQVAYYPELSSKQALFRGEFERLAPAKNATNQLKRGIAWGVLLKEELGWTRRKTYKLDATLNREESGNVREFTLLSDEFLGDPVINDIIIQKFNTWGFKEDSYVRAYEVQVSLIGYETSLTQTALPSPVYVHQDMVDGSVTVLDTQGCFEGGVTRVFNLRGNMLVEASLDIGESIFMVDKITKHVVTPISVPYGAPQSFGRRLLMIVRFQPLGR